MRFVEAHSRPTPNWTPPTVLLSLKLPPSPPGTGTGSSPRTGAPAPAPEPAPEPEPAPAPTPAPLPDPEPAPSESAPPTAPVPQAATEAPAKKSNIRSVLIIGATFVSAVILIILMIVFALQAG